MTHMKSAKILRSYLWITAGSALFCIGFNALIAPNRIGFGGMTGIAQVINAAIPTLPIGALVLAMNLPLFYFGWRFLGGHLLFSSLFAMFLTSAGLDMLSAVYTFSPMEDTLLAAIFGGAVIGLALGVIFTQGATTGGSDLAARLLKLKLTWLPLGKVLMVPDLCVILAVAAAFGELYTALYGGIAVFVSSYVTDKVLYGLDTSKVAYIITSCPSELVRAITYDLQRGATILHGTGAWSGENREVLMCAFKQKQIVPLKALVHALDPGAFLIVCDAHEVLGQGFRRYQKNDL